MTLIILTLKISIKFVESRFFQELETPPLNCHESIYNIIFIYVRLGMQQKCVYNCVLLINRINFMIEFVLWRAKVIVAASMLSNFQAFDNNNSINNLCNSNTRWSQNTSIRYDNEIYEWKWMWFYGVLQQQQKKDTSVYSMLMLIKVPPLENLVDYSWD